MIRALKSLGLNYAWGLANFAVGVALGGAYVAITLLVAGAVR